MEKRVFIGWIKINFIFFIGSFGIFSVFSILFPEIFIELGRNWGAYSNNLMPKILEQTSEFSLFVNIVFRNSLILILYFIASILFLAPLISLIAGAFYALGFMSFIDHFINSEILYSFWCSPILILIETSFVMLTISFASTLASEIFEVSPERKSILNYWKENWKRFFPKPKKAFREVLSKNKTNFVVFILVILFLLLYGAFFEVMIAFGILS